VCASEKLTELEKLLIMLDAILDELAMGTVFVCRGRQLRNLTEIADAMREGRGLVVEYHCKWCGAICDQSHRCREHDILEILEKVRQ